VLGGVAWWMGGYTLAFGQNGDSWPSSIEDHSFWFFQWSFAATAATIDSGALAERVNFIPYCILSIAMTGFIYPYVVSWVWQAEGWLAQDGFYDFAGGCIIHMMAGCSALVSCAMLGPRIGRFLDYTPRHIWVIETLFRRSADADFYVPLPGNIPIQPVRDAVSMIWGVFFLWVGWYGFNPGGVTGIEFGGGTYVAGKVFVNTTLGAIGGGTTDFVLQVLTLITGRGSKGHVVAEGLAHGILSGLVAVTAGVVWFGNGSSFLVGAIGALCGRAAKVAVERAYIDDVVSAVSIHGAAGWVGTVAIGLWAEPWPCQGPRGDGPIGLFYARTSEEVSEAWHLLWVQFYGSIVVALWAAGTTFIVVAVLNQIPKLNFRLDRWTELHGLDELEHGMVNEMYNFKTAMVDMVEKLAKGNGDPEEVKDVCQSAVRCMSQDHLMLALKFDRISTVSDLLFTITDLTLEGANLPERAQLKVEIVNESQGFGGGHRYFAPRWTKESAPREGDALSWGTEAVKFKRFYLPYGTELSMGVSFTIAQKRTILPIGTATVLLHECDWERNEGALTTGLLRVPLNPNRARSFGIRFTSRNTSVGTNLRVRMLIENLTPDVSPTPEDAWEMLMRNSTISRMTAPQEARQAPGAGQPRATTPRPSRTPARSPTSTNLGGKSGGMEARLVSLEQLVSTLNQNLHSLSNRLDMNLASVDETRSNADVTATNNFLVVV